MGVQIDVEYKGGLRCESVHAPSKAVLLTDAPADNHGKGEAFSPTDLVATALASCILTTMGIFAQRHEIDMAGATATVVKEMVATPIRRIGKLTCEVRMPLPAAHPQREALERAAHTCPVHQSLHPDVVLEVRIEWIG